MALFKKESVPLILLVLSCILFAANFVIRMVGLPETARIYYFDIATATLALIAAIISFMAFLNSPKASLKRKLWMLEAVYFSMLVLGEAAWGFYEIVLRIETPIISVADIFWMASYGIQIWAVILLSRNVFIKREYYFYAIGAGLLAFMAFYFGFFMDVIASLETSFLEKFLSIAYPFLDILCAAIITPLFITSVGGGRIFSFARFISLGFLCFAIFDCLYYYMTWNEIYYTGHPLDIVYDAAYLFFALAGYYGYAHLLGVKSIAEKECGKCKKR